MDHSDYFSSPGLVSVAPSSSPPGPNPTDLTPQASISSTPTNPYNNFQSTQDTIQAMIGLTHECLNPIHPAIHMAMVDIASKIGNPYGESPKQIDIIRGVYWWVKRHINFVEDERHLISGYGYTEDDIMDTGGKELLLSPAYLVQMPEPTGDCDDFSTLLATLLIGLGVSDVYFCAIAANASEPDRYSHVYCKVMTENGPMALDASHGKYPGWETAERYKELNWRVG